LIARNAWIATAACLVSLSCSTSSSDSDKELPSSDADGGSGFRPEPPRIQQGLSIKLEDGVVHGAMDQGARTFIGIPYAAPPVGPRRFAPPTPVTPWEDTLEATGPGVKCMRPGAVGEVPMSEDCLTVNVFAPEVSPPDGAPVFVWLHGGGNWDGSANAIVASGIRLYDGARLRAASRRDVVVVTVNYRLGPFGFLAHPALTREQDGGSGNYGLRDQQLALKWVQSNIAAFGGDPKNVTLAGESAGAVDTCYQLVASGNDGLFHRAIIQSNSCTPSTQPLSEAEHDGEAYAASLGCDDASDAIECLRGKDAGALFQPESPRYPGKPLLFSPLDTNWGKRTYVLATIDGKFLKEKPVVALKEGRFLKVPIIIGSNTREGAIFVQSNSPVAANGDTRFAGEDEYRASVGTTFEDQADKVLQAYTASEFGSVDEAATQVIGDYYFSCPVFTFARLVSKWSDVYVYHWARGAESIQQFKGFGATHSVELMSLWDVWDLPFGLPEEDKKFGKQMIDYWTQFAATGDPNGDALPAWPRYSAEADDELKFADVIATDSGRGRARCPLWNDVFGTLYGDDWRDL
jgi:para-nitrobenzyl esterase